MVNISPVCAVCGVENEDVMHALVLCDYAKIIWAQSNLPLPSTVTNIFYEWFDELLNILDSDGILYAAAILYYLWRTRNEAVWNARVTHPRRMLVAVRVAVAAWHQVHAAAAPPTVIAPQGAAPTAIRQQQLQLSPHRQHAKCYVDAAYHGGSDKATAGTVLIGGDRHFISAFAAPLPHCYSPIMAEAYACKEALSWLRDRGVQSVELLTDCQTLQKYLTPPYQLARSYTGYALDGCRNHIATFTYCHVHFIPRSQNYLAHSLAASAFHYDIAMYWDDIPPDAISAYL
ncbi:PREDICTED: uncharacterized protein LOC109175404 [Ipomoea nil]|uniref:uncharacterized protein LOC109175404 n=1 Tax=Ipomoea nil TaxID=35883 RepID=UPI0009018CD1|nr:PREDICTED: uncharacterized protein LOC109175404 [Ipomoea nil]